MNKNFEEFIRSINVTNTAKVINSYHKISQWDYTNCTQDDIKNIILSMKPNSPRMITTICYAMKLYARYLENEKLYKLVQDIDRNELWAIAKTSASKKFISYEDFKDAYHAIGVYEELNSFYYQMLFKCLYEGIYNDDLSVIKNLRASDINNNVITLREDSGHLYCMEVSDEFAIDLKELSLVNTWERKNRYGVFGIRIDGVHHDSCFKIENRKGSGDTTYRFSYYRMLRKISKDYLECNIHPFQLFISGIMHRIKAKLQEHDISLEEAFRDQNRNRLVAKIISDELKRCNCSTEVRNFRELVKGHLEVFDK